MFHTSMHCCETDSTARASGALELKSQWHRWGGRTSRQRGSEHLSWSCSGPGEWWKLQASLVLPLTHLCTKLTGGSSTAESAENWRDLPVWGSVVVARFSDLSKTSGPMLILLEKNCQETQNIRFLLSEVLQSQQQNCLEKKKSARNWERFMMGMHNWNTNGPVWEEEGSLSEVTEKQCQWCRSWKALCTVPAKLMARRGAVVFRLVFCCSSSLGY